MAQRLSESELHTELMKLLPLPSSNLELLNILHHMEKLLIKVQRRSRLFKSWGYPMLPVTEALFAKELMGHSDMNVNILVACSICEILRIMDAPCNKEQMKELVELTVITFEKLPSASGGNYTKMSKVVKTLSRVRFSVLMSDLQMDGLIVRLFKQFLIFAKSSSATVLLYMEKIMTMIIEKSESFNLELVELLVTSARKEKQITSSVCWQLARKIIKNCASRLLLHLPDKVAKEVYGSLRETISSTSDASKLREDATRKKKFEGPKSSGNILDTLWFDDDFEEPFDPKQERMEWADNGPPISDSEAVEKTRAAFPSHSGQGPDAWHSVSPSFATSNDRCRHNHLDGTADATMSCPDTTAGQQKWLAPIEKAVTKLFHVYRKLDGDVSRLEERVEAISNDRQPPKVQTKMPTMSEFQNEDFFEDRQLGDIYMEMPTTSEFAAEDTRHLHKEREITPPSDSVMPVLHDNGDEELLDVNQEHPQSVENVSPMPNCALPRKVSSPRCDTICVQGYKVKQSDAPILEAIFKKHGDIAAECKFKVTSVRVSMLEVVCEVVRRVQNNEGIVKREEIEGQMSDIEAANFDVLWLRAHLEAIYKREAATKKSTLLTEMKGNAILVKRVAQMDLKERCAELVAVKERFKNGERCVKVLDLVEKNLNDNILESKAEDDLWAKEPILELLHEKVSSPLSGIISVRGYKVKEGVGRILEALFKKHGDIAAECVLKTASLRASFLEVVCEVVRRILTDDVTKIISEIEEIKSQVSDADAVNVNVSWIRAHLEAIHKRNEAMKKSTMLMEIKSTTTLVKQEAQKDLEERNAELVATQKRFENAERCVKVLGLVETKLSNDILESKAEKDSWVEQPVL